MEKSLVSHICVRKKGLMHHVITPCRTELYVTNISESLFVEGSLKMFHLNVH